tara:strand:- start:1286 stop:2425 length:1140 start_codon:yes stop_codon:yes gene_type:complete
MKFHPLCEIFPISERDIASLAEDIKENGLNNEIDLYGDKILDGRHRLKACLIAGVEPRFKDFTGADPLKYVVSQNLRRRQLNESQRAMVAASIANMKEGRQESNAQICAVSQTEAAEMLNVSRRAVQSAKKVKEQGVPKLVQKVKEGTLAVSTAAELAELSEEEQLKMVEGSEFKDIIELVKKVKQIKGEKKRQQRFDKITEISLGNKELKTDQKYPIILADPPWRYELSPCESRAIENQYPTMTLEEIKELQVQDITTKDAILFMWTTATHIQDAFEVIEAWGFEYKSMAIWDKEIIGLGFYFRQQHEILLVATKGNFPTPAPENRPSSIIRERRNTHSQKPQISYEIIEQMYPDIPKIELFSRNKREGWDNWGNQSV